MTNSTCRLGRPTFPLESVACCPLCESAARREVACAEDVRFGYPGKFPAFACDACGMLYLGERIQQAYLPQLYSAYYETARVTPSRRMPKLRRAIKTLLRPVYPDTLDGRDLRQRKAILEIGPGMRPVHDRFGWKGDYYAAVEYDDKALVALRARFGQDFIFPSLSLAVAPPGKRQIECCIADQVLEHLYDPVRFLSDAKTVLSELGLIVLATPNGDSRFRRVYGDQWIGWHAPYHAMLHTPRSLAALADKCGLKIRTIRAFTPGSWARLQFSSVGRRFSLLDLASIRLSDIAGGAEYGTGDNLYCVFET